MTVIVSIADLVESVRQARANHEELSAQIAARRQAFEASIRDELDLLAEAKLQVEETERMLRHAAVDYFAATGEKRPHPAVQIREGRPKTVFEYPKNTALGYALNHQVALQLDESALETYLQAVPEPIRPPWFHIRTETPAPVATIARDLNQTEPSS